MWIIFFPFACLLLFELSYVNQIIYLPILPVVRLFWKFTTDQNEQDSGKAKVHNQANVQLSTVISYRWPLKLTLSCLVKTNCKSQTAGFRFVIRQYVPNPISVKIQYSRMKNNVFFTGFTSRMVIVAKATNVQTTWKKIRNAKIYNCG